MSTVSDYVIRLAKRAGVKLTMHSLRNGFGCRCAGEVPVQVLQELRHHSDIKTTMAYYANVDAAVEEAVFGPQPNSSPTEPRTAKAGEPAGLSRRDKPGGSLWLRWRHNRGRPEAVNERAGRTTRDGSERANDAAL
jgi:hypothetical protein